MTDVDLDEVTNQLQKTSVGCTSGVSFKGKSLKLNSEEDAKQVVEAIETCANLQYLDLEGNSLGVDAAKGIAKALESHGELKRALWKDLFTGRMKTEIPKALEFLGGGLMLAGARLTVLDLSDNAFGPIGVEGLVVLLRSSSCYSLEVLKLNNNGLGITGGKMLAKGLLDCYTKSKESGSPLALRVFVAGRNRLENDGARALAEVFKKVGSLCELHMPQNGIYHVGIAALSDALKSNPNLEVLNLNDNTVTFRGVAAIANALPTLQKLREIDLGDCLLRTKGAVNLAIALTEGHRHLEKLLLDCNEIGASGGILLAKAMKNKHNLTKLSMNGNQFGEQGRLDICSELKKNGQYEFLDSLDEDEDEEEEEDDDEEEEEEEEEEDEEEEEEDGDNISEKSDDAVKNGGNGADISVKTVESIMCSSILQNLNLSSISVTKFIENSTPEYFMALGDNRTELILQEVTRSPDDEFLEKLLSVLMKVSSMSVCNSEQIRQAALACSNVLYEELFSWAKKKNKSSIVNNALMVHLGLIKSEDKSLKLTWNIDGCLKALDDAMSKSLIPEETQEIVHVFRGRKAIDIENGTVVPV